jgi:hypothetical protein
MRKLTDRLLSLALMLPGTRGYLEHIEPEMMTSSEQRGLFLYLRAHPEFDGQINQAPELIQIADYVKIVSLQFEELYGEVDTLELQYEAARLRVRLIDIYVKTQKNQLSYALQTASDSEAKKLLEKSRELDQLLNKIKE